MPLLTDAALAAALRARVALAVAREVALVGGQPPSGVMVALVPPLEVAAQLVVPGGEPLAELHVTLAFLGKAADLDDPAKLRLTVENFADLSAPLAGAFNGIGRFSGTDEEGDPFVALLDAPALPAWRQQLVQELSARGFPVASTHGYTPHCTLVYVQGEAPLPLQALAPISVTFDALTLAIAGKRSVYPLGSRAVALAAPAADDAHVHRLIAAGGAAVALLAAQLRAGRITKAQFIKRATARLSGNAEAAGRLGAAQYGSAADFDTAALDGIGNRVDGFADTAADTGNSDKQVASWALALGGIAWGVYNHGRADGAEAVGLTEAVWHCKDDKNSCDSCTALADGSPYTIDELPTFPAGDVDCGGNCRCWLSFSKG